MNPHSATKDAVEGRRGVRFDDETCQQCRKLFPALSGPDLPAFLDGPAGTQVPASVISAIGDFYRSANANLGGHFVRSELAADVVRRAREASAALLGATDGRTISFGPNMTSLAFSLSRAIAKTIEPGDEIVITQLDHEANRQPWLDLTRAGARIREVEIRADGGGQLDRADLEAKITAKTRLVAIAHASNALGTVNDVAYACRLAREVGAWSFVDSVHSAPHLPIDVEAMKADFLACSAYKFYGPHVGILYSRPGVLDQLETDRLATQGQNAPSRIETGIQNLAALAGVEAAIEFMASWGEGAALRIRLSSAMQAISTYERALASEYAARASTLPGVRVWGPEFDDGPRAPTVSITVASHTSEMVAKQLAARGVQVWNGHFYAPRPIEILGLLDRGGLMRVGFCVYNSREELERLLQELAELVHP